jgi:hypothetical protein
MITRTWFLHLGEMATVCAAGGALSTVSEAGSWRAIPWENVCASAGYGALVALLAAVASLKITPGNGTASLIRGVISADSRKREWKPGGHK